LTGLQESRDKLDRSQARSFGTLKDAKKFLTKSSNEINWRQSFPFLFVRKYFVFNRRFYFFSLRRKLCANFFISFVRKWLLLWMNFLPNTFSVLKLFSNHVWYIYGNVSTMFPKMTKICDEFRFRRGVRVKLIITNSFNEAHFSKPGANHLRQFSSEMNLSSPKLFTDIVSLWLWQRTIRPKLK